MKVRKRRLRPIRFSVFLRGGPFNGHVIKLESSTGKEKDTLTLPLAPMKGFTPGRYVGGNWEPI